MNFLVALLKNAGIVVLSVLFITAALLFVFGGYFLIVNILNSTILGICWLFFWLVLIVALEVTLDEQKRSR